MRFQAEMRMGKLPVLTTYKLDLESVGDRTEHAIVAQEIPGRSGAVLQHQGANAQVVQLRAYWLSDTYEQHFAFRAALKELAACEFVHPELGLLRGMIKTSSFRYDRRKLTAEADLEFVEEAPATDPAPRVDAVAASESRFTASQAEQAAAFATAVRAELGAEAAGILAQELDPSMPVLSQFSLLSAKARSYLRTVDQAEARYTAILQDVANPANSLLATIHYGLTLPDRFVGGLARTCERYSLALEALRSSPRKFLMNLQASMWQLVQSVPGLEPSARRAAAARLGLEAGYLFGEDEDRRDDWRKQESEEPFDAAGQYQAPSRPLQSMMSAREAEDSLALVRADLQAAVDEDRTQEALAGLGHDLLEHVRSVKLEYDRVVELDVPNPTPLHLVLVRAGLPLSYADRVLALNPAIKRPNFVQGRIKVYARPA